MPDCLASRSLSRSNSHSLRQHADDPITTEVNAATEVALVQDRC
jgi:hypothetical protein